MKGLAQTAVYANSIVQTALKSDPGSVCFIVQCALKMTGFKSTKLNLDFPLYKGGICYTICEP